MPRHKWRADTHAGFLTACTAEAHLVPWTLQMKLEETFGELDVWLAAENGIFMRPPGGEWITLLEARMHPLILI